VWQGLFKTGFIADGGYHGDPVGARGQHRFSVIQVDASNGYNRYGTESAQTAESFHAQWLCQAGF
jgi:hypothetical protein